MIYDVIGIIKLIFKFNTIIFLLFNEVRIVYNLRIYKQTELITNE